jgi:hypothetical protein
VLQNETPAASCRLKSEKSPVCPETVDSLTDRVSGGGKIYS